MEHAKTITKGKYVCTHDYEGAFVGTVAEILDWSFTESVDLNDCEFYALDKKVKLSIGFEVDSEIS